MEKFGPVVYAVLCKSYHLKKPDEDDEEKIENKV